MFFTPTRLEFYQELNALHWSPNLENSLQGRLAGHQLNSRKPRRWKRRWTARYAQVQTCVRQLRVLKLRYAPPAIDHPRRRWRKRMTTFRYQPGKQRWMTKSSSGVKTWPLLPTNRRQLNKCVVILKDTYENWRRHCTSVEVCGNGINCNRDDDNGRKTAEWHSMWDFS